MNYRGYMKPEIRAELEARDARESAQSWLRVCEARYAEAMKGRSRIQQTARLTELEDARRACYLR